MRGLAVGVGSGAVVGDFEHDVAALVIGVQPDDALVELSGRASGLGGLEAMVDRVPYEVKERVRESVEHGLVELGFLAVELEPRVLSEGKPGVSDGLKVYSSPTVKNQRSSLAFFQLAFAPRPFSRSHVMRFRSVKYLSPARCIADPERQSPHI
jgi:hypothetical protein